LIVP